MTALKIIRIGNSLGVILPKDMLGRFSLDAGDEMHLVEGRDGFNLTPYDPGFAEQMKIGREIMRDRRNALHELAK